MLQDNKHWLISKISVSVEHEPVAKQLSTVHAKFPSGLIRGALHALGVTASVGVEVCGGSVCQFTIQIQTELP
jgi:hypothetical protein